MFCMKNRDTLMKQSLQNPNRQIVRPCIPNLEGIYFVMNTLLQTNTGTTMQLYIAMNKQAQNYISI